MFSFIFVILIDDEDEFGNRFKIIDSVWKTEKECRRYIETVEYMAEYMLVQEVELSPSGNSIVHSEVTGKSFAEEYDKKYKNG